jgi:hypothetical protein
MSTLTAISMTKTRSSRIPIARVLLYLLVLSFPFFSVEPKIFRPDWWIGGALIVVFAFSVLARGRFRLDPIGHAVLWFNAAVLLSTAVNFWSWEAAQWVEFLTLWLQLIFATLLYFALSNLKLSIPEMRFLLKLWIGIAVMVALYGLYQALARNLDLPFAYVPHLHPELSPSQLEWGLGFAGYMRPSSVLREPTYLGNYLLGPLLIAAILTFFKRDQLWLFKSRGWNRASVFILFAAFITSFSLAGYITLLSVILIAALLNRLSRKLALRLIGIGIVALILIAIVSLSLDLRLVSAIVGRSKWAVQTVILAEEIGALGTSEGVRLQEVILALSVWTHYPMVGIGLNQLQFVGKLYAPEMLLSYVAEAGYTHNIWLEVLVQSGALGLFFFGLTWFQALRMIRSSFRRSGEPLRWLCFALFFVLLATIIRGLMGGPFTFTLYWFYLGLTSIVYNLARSEECARSGSLEENTRFC